MKKNRIINLWIVAMLFSLSLSAQQLPVYDLYHLNRILINPANTGDYGTWSAFLDSRNQWVGINGAPKTRIFGVHGLLKNNMGIGGFVISDRTGLLDRMSMNLNYAYMVKLAENHQLTFALNGVLTENQFLMSNAQVKDYNDNLLTLQSFEGMRFDAGFGFRYNFKKLEVGFSVPYLLQSKVRYFTAENNEYVFDFYRHFNAIVSYRFNLKNDNWAIEPVLVYRDARHSPSQLDLNVVTKWKNQYWLGLGYRNSGRTWVESAGGGDYTEINLSLANSYFLLSGGITLLNNIDIAYGYEVSNSSIYDRSHGTHEIMLIYTFGQGRKGKSYDEDIKMLKENQLAMTAKLDTLGNKMDANIATTNSIAGVNNQQSKMIEGLKEDIDKLRNDLANLPQQPGTTPSTKEGTTEKVVEKVTVVSGGGYNSVYFKTGSYILSREAKTELLKFIALAKDATNKIEISGYADDVGEEETNLLLSQQRAKEVYNYLVKNGIAPERITMNYYGEEKPLVPNTSYEARSLNRRVDVMMVK
ncbi:MAG TPA: PorP/SprF family type IX secretion system membrane protein [Bacteroidia bacterium]|nr:PorP/SprF family type IX secretion system membrane protein [Sphingobacteriales bacterium]HPD64841.1 PorP/SprF family type IX secretion system membrane protein [Bacteroidia bacterium]HRS58445.1 PorP/SprF family type IX secretion system membrane protein [Bacteroidia bacterium]